MNVEAVHELFCPCLHDDFAILKEPEGVWLVVVFAAPLGGGLKPGEGGEQSHCELRGRERFLAEHFPLLRYLFRGGNASRPFYSMLMSGTVPGLSLAWIWGPSAVRQR